MTGIETVTLSIQEVEEQEIFFKFFYQKNSALLSKKNRYAIFATNLRRTKNIYHKFSRSCFVDMESKVIYYIQYVNIYSRF